MKFKRSTIGLLGAAIALVAAVAIFETTKNTQPESGDALYEFTEGDVTRFSIDREETPLAFAKTDDTWQMTEPQDVPADPSSIAFLLNIITSDTITETITAKADQLDDYGLEDPSAIVNMTVGEEEYILAVGDEDFSGTSLYTMTVDEPADTEASVDVYLMPNSLTTGLERPTEEWILQSEEGEDAAEEEPQSESDSEDLAEEKPQSEPDGSADETSDDGSDSEPDEPTESSEDSSEQ